MVRISDLLVTSGYRAYASQSPKGRQDCAKGCLFIVGGIFIGSCIISIPASIAVSWYPNDRDAEGKGMLVGLGILIVIFLAILAWNKKRSNK